MSIHFTHGQSRLIYFFRVIQHRVGTVLPAPRENGVRREGRGDRRARSQVAALRRRDHGRG